MELRLKMLGKFGIFSSSFTRYEMYRIDTSYMIRHVPFEIQKLRRFFGGLGSIGTHYNRRARR